MGLLLFPCQSQRQPGEHRHKHKRQRSATRRSHSSHVRGTYRCDGHNCGRRSRADMGRRDGQFPSDLYNVYYSQNLADINSGAAPSYSTMALSMTATGLTNDRLYYFSVFAKDFYQNATNGAVVMTVTPTDKTSPAFAGLTSATDTTVGGEVLLRWNSATDHSTPITYNITRRQHPADTISLLRLTPFRMPTVTTLPD